MITPQAPLLLLGRPEEDGLAQAFLAAARALGLPVRLVMAASADDIDPLQPAGFALACSAALALPAAQLNDRSCTGGISARLSGHLRDPAIGLAMLGYHLGLALPADPGATGPRESASLLITATRAQIFWRAEGDGRGWTMHGAAAATLAPALVRAQLRNGRGWGRGLLHIEGVRGMEGFRLTRLRQAIDPAWHLYATAAAPDFHRRLLAALLLDAPLDMTPPAPVVRVDLAAGTVTLAERLAA